MDNSEQKKVLAEEIKILQEEKDVLREVKKEEKLLKKMIKNTWLMSGLVLAVIVAGIVGVITWQILASRIYSDKAKIVSPRIDLAPQAAGSLQDVFVNVGDYVKQNTVVAQVGNELIKTQTSGVVVDAKKDIGRVFNRGEEVVSLINPNELRLVAAVEENKGLSDIRIGQTAVFTVDAFGSKKYIGVVDEISQTSKEGDIVFNISDKRQAQEFNVYVRFNIDQYPELKNGMSAKLWIYK